jgi:tRNA pseudouridine55 synthase
MRHGLLLLDKQAGGTSHDAVQQVRRMVRQKKVGHCGTLDPSATGLLLLTLGNATRLTRFLIRAPKVYEGEITFGAATDTYDAEGTVTAEATPEAVEALTHDAVAAAMAAFEGDIEQAPPPYSAKKVGGVKLYEMARRGEETPSEPKPVSVYEFTPLGDLADGRIRFRLACSTGTYARSLAHDVGRAVGTGAHLSALRRLSVGDFRVEDSEVPDPLAGRLEELAPPPPEPPDDEPSEEPGEDEAGGGRKTKKGKKRRAPWVAVPEGALAEAAGAAFIPFDRIPLPMAEAVVDAQQERRLLHGQTALLKDLDAEEGDWVRLASREGKFLAVGSVTERIGRGSGVGIVQPRVVFK